mmetsp:Transcript_31417/g.59759  ORF Transcript_31417/g.59759 Transcript_31417/m.59759 type:complete len:862 (+) Transcript_31417:4969-7554(+)
MGVGRSEAVVLVHTGDAAADDDADADDVEVVDREVGSSSSSDAIIFLMIRLLEDDVVVVVVVSPNRESAIQNVSEELFDESKTTTNASQISQPPETTTTTTTTTTHSTEEVTRWEECKKEWEEKRGQEPEGEVVGGSGIFGNALSCLKKTNKSIVNGDDDDDDYYDDDDDEDDPQNTDEIEMGNSSEDPTSNSNPSPHLRIARPNSSKFRRSDAQTLRALRDEIALLPECDASAFLRRACGDGNVAAEAIRCILSIFPDAASVDDEENRYTPPLHVACRNVRASRESIELVMKANPSALLKMSLLEEEEEEEGGGGAVSGTGSAVIEQNDTDSDTMVVEGLPLHYYLMRERNIDLDTVRMLVEAYPRALGAGDDTWRLTPIHALVSNPNIATHVDHDDDDDDDDDDNTPTLLLDVVRYLVHAKPSSVRMIDERDRIPLHSACTNKNANHSIVNFLLDHWPESTRQRDENGNHPIHSLCTNGDLDDDGVSMEILALLIRADGESAKDENDAGCFPIHLAAENGKPPEFCEVLVDAYPESVEMGSDDGSLPLHKACGGGCLDTAKYLAELYPRGLDVEAVGGVLPIHVASNGKADFEIIEYLLRRDPDCASKPTEGGELPFHLACKAESNLDAVRLLFDTYPEALILEDEDNNDATTTTTTTMTSTEARSSSGHANMASFLHDQTSHARTALDIAAMHTLDESGCLPLHRALRGRAALGAVKLLLEGNPSALRVATYDSVFPLHVACERCGLDVVRFLSDRLPDVGRFEDADSSGNSALHYACRGGNCDVVRWLLERSGAGKSRRAALPSSFADGNDDGKFPIQLLAEYCKKEGEDCQSLKFGMTVLCLRLAYPERVFAGGVL